MRAARALAPLFFCVFLASGGARGEVGVEEINYRGWRGAYRMANGEAEIVVVPAIARIMHFSLAGGENVLWQNERLLGETGKPGEWMNFGGDKAWIWPQASWKSKWGVWPPPHECDQAPHMAAVSSPPMVSLTSPEVSGYGVRIVRGIGLGGKGARAEIRTVARPAGGGSKERWAAWTVTQARMPDFILARLAPGWRIDRQFLNDTTWSSIGRIEENVLKLDPPKKGAAKVGMDADLLAWVKGDLMFTQRVTSADPVVNGVEPGELAQVFATSGSEKPGDEPYVELEFTSPRAEMTGDGLAVVDVIWNLERLSPRLRDPRELARELAAR